MEKCNLPHSPVVRAFFVTCVTKTAFPVARVTGLTFESRVPRFIYLQVEAMEGGHGSHFDDPGSTPLETSAQSGRCPDKVLHAGRPRGLQIDPEACSANRNSSTLLGLSVPNVFLTSLIGESHAEISRCSYPSLRSHGCRCWDNDYSADGAGKLVR